LQDYEAETWTLRHRVELPLTYFGFGFGSSATAADPARRAVSVGAGGAAVLIIGDPRFHVLRWYHHGDKNSPPKNFSSIP
jgi:hypothetical protein